MWGALPGNEAMVSGDSEAVSGLPSMAMEHGDAALVGRVLAGDTEAYAELVERHKRWVINLAYQLLADPEEAQDAAQDAFVTAYQKLGQLRFKRNFRAWLRKIVVHCALRRRRRADRRRPLEVDLADAGAASGHTAVAVHQVLRQMPEHLAVVLILRELHALSYREIARTLEIPVGTVRSRLHAAREYFRQLWEADV